MRQRITYLLPQGAGVDISDITVGRNDLRFAHARSVAEERRMTIGLSDLPQKVQDAFEEFHELHVRISSVQNYLAAVPDVSRIPPGLHAFLTPRNSSKGTRFCEALKLILGSHLKCGSDEESFSKPSIQSERFATSSTYQYYHGPLDFQTVASSLQQHLCGQSIRASSSAPLCDLVTATKSATNVDIDFDVISHAVTVTVLWNPSETEVADENRMPIHKSTTDDRLEVGVLQAEKANEVEELSLGGYLTTVGEDDHSSPTLFSFPSRHHPLPTLDQTGFITRFQQPSGLHPKFEIIFPTRPASPPKDSCALHAYWTLPSTLFIDRYQLSDPLFLASQNLVALHSLSGEQDLEAPDWAIKRWGSAALLELATPPASHEGDNWTVTIPTHLRYVQALSEHGEQAQVSIPWPVVFWACEAEDGLKMPTNPFDRVNLGYDGLFGPKTMFYHVPPAVAPGTRLAETLNVPIMGAKLTEFVPLGTMAAVLLGFGWICWQLVGSGRVGERQTAEKKKGR